MSRNSVPVTSSVISCLICSGCSRAPSVEIVGSFFPIWMICIAAGVIVAFIARVLLLRYRIENQLQPLWLFYPCTVTLCACLLWLILYR